MKKLVTTDRINECVQMLETLKASSSRLEEISTGKTHTILKDINPDSLKFVINEAIDLIEEL